MVVEADVVDVVDVLPVRRLPVWIPVTELFRRVVHLMGEVVTVSCHPQPHLTLRLIREPVETPSFPTRYAGTEIVFHNH